MLIFFDKHTSLNYKFIFIYFNSSFNNPYYKISKNTKENLMKIFKYIILILLINLLFTGCFLSTNINSGGQVGMSVGGTVF